MIKSPLLAATLENISDLTDYPVVASPKIDGIRCLVLDGQAYTYSRSNKKFKPLRNRQIRACLKTLPNGLDGEIITINSQGAYDEFNTVQSKVMSEHVTCKFQYLLFDYIPNQQTKVPFAARNNLLKDLTLPFFCSVLEQTLIKTRDHLEEYEETIVAAGFEGIMIRSVDGFYKEGRSTLNEGILLKVKRFLDAEATVIDYEELVREHTSEPTGLLGALICRSDDDIIFNIGTGFTEEQRRNFWVTRNLLRDKRVTFKYMKHGMKDKPRHPVFLRFRSDL